MLQACQPENELVPDPELPAQVETMETARMLDAIRELNEISTTILLDEDVALEVREVAENDFYRDYYVGLHDLLSPDDVEVYRSRDVRKAGSYRDAFNRVFDREQYPNLAYYVDKPFELELTRRSGGFEDNAGLFYYCPYCPRYDKDATNFTVVPSLSNADEAEGFEPQSDGSYVSVMTDDVYAMGNETLLISPEVPGGVDGAPIDTPYKEEGCFTDGNGCKVCELTEMSTGNLIRQTICPRGGGGGSSDHHTWQDCEGVNRVFVGHQQVTAQHDNWANVEGNGGGSEMRFGRIGVDAVANVGGQFQVNGFAAIAQMFVKRGDIGDEEVEWWGALLDPGWECIDGPQRFFGWEEDNNSVRTVGGSLSIPAGANLNILGGAELTLSGPLTLSYSLAIPSDDDPLYQQTYTRDQYIESNRLDESCGTRAIPTGLHSRFDAGAEIAIRCGNEANWTLPDVNRF